MPSIVAQNAEALRALVARLLPEAEAVVDWCPDFALPETGRLRAVVVPDQYELAVATRGGNAYKLLYAVVVMRRCERAEIPALAALAVGLGEALLRRPLAPGAWVMGVQHDPLYVPEFFLQDRLFFSELTVTAEAGHAAP